MKRKILILIPLIFILCGCTAEVNIKIDTNKIVEDVTIDAYPDNYITKDQLLNAFRNYIPIYYDEPIVDTMPDEKVDGVSYYTKTVKDLGNGYRFNYTNNFGLANYTRARTVKGAFKSSTLQINKKDREIVLSTDKSEMIYFNEYPSLTKVTVNITPVYKVKESNADSVNGNTYTWNFDKNTAKNIYMSLNTSELYESNNGSSNNGNNNEPNHNQGTSYNTKKEYDNEAVSFVNEHPVLTAILAIIGFIILVFIITKVSKKKY